MSQWSAKFVIYENHVNKHIGIHKNGCNQIEKMVELAKEVYRFCQFERC